MKSFLPPTFSTARARGFTLMETLVMLMIVSMATTLMFQMLDSYRVAQQRIAAQAGNQDRSSLFESWLIDEVHGLSPDPDREFKGSASQFEGSTLNPLYGSAGAPSPISWRLEKTVDGGDIEYAEDGEKRWALPLRDFQGARFVYLDGKGVEHSQWPPAKGLQGGLPAAIALVRGKGPSTRVRLAAVRGPLLPIERPFEAGEE